jgi:Zn-dependent protease with chaperone function
MRIRVMLECMLVLVAATAPVAAAQPAPNPLGTSQHADAGNEWDDGDFTLLLEQCNDAVTDSGVDPEGALSRFDLWSGSELDHSLPRWTGWLSLPHNLLVALIVAGLLCLWVRSLALRPLRRLCDAPWVERARLAYPAQVAFGILGLLPVVVLLTVSATSSPLSRVPGLVEGSICAAAVLMVLFFATRSAWSEIWKRRITVGHWLAGWLTVLLFFFPSYVIAGVVLGTLPAEWGVRAAILLAVGVVVAFWFEWGGSMLLARGIGVARPARERLARIIEKNTADFRVNANAVYEIRWPVANAFVIPLSRQMGVSDVAMQQLSDEEVSAICTHELSHLNEPRGMLVARTIGSLALLPYAALKPVMGSFGPTSALVLAVGWTVALVLIRRMGQRMETRADRSADAHGGQPGIYARALERLYEVNLIPAVMPGRLNVHPHLYDRLIDVGMQPGYPRPTPPSRIRGPAIALPALLLFPIMMIIVQTFCSLAVESWSEHGLLAAAAIATGDSAIPPAAEQQLEQSDPATAAALYMAASAADRRSVGMPARAAMALADAGRHDLGLQLVCESTRRYLEQPGGDRELLQRAWDAIRPRQSGTAAPIR